MNSSRKHRRLFTLLICNAFAFSSINSNATEYQVLWENLYEVRSDYSQNDLVKIVNSASWSAAAFSDNTLAGNTNGYVRYLVENENGGKAFGFSVTDDGVSASTIDYGWQLSRGSGGRLYIVENGTIVGSYGSPSVNDELKIERNGSNIKYYRNGSLYRTVSTTASNSLHVDGAIFNFNTHLKSVKCDFNHSVYAYPTYTHLSPTSRGTIELVASGGTGPYKFYWGDGWLTETAFDNLIDDLPSELQTSVPDYDNVFLTDIDSISLEMPTDIGFTVSDYNNDYYQGKAELSHSLINQTLTGISVSGFDLQRTATSGTIEAKFYNGILSNEITDVVFSISNSAAEYRVGFRNSGDGVHSGGTQIKNGVRIYSGTLYMVYDSSQTSVSTGITTLDEIGIRIATDTLYVFKNGSQVGKHSINPNLVWYHDFYIGTKDAIITLKKIQSEHINKYTSPRITIHDISCLADPPFGSISYYFPFSGTAPIFELEGEGVDFSNSSGSYTFEDLYSGNYELSATISGTTLTYPLDVAFEVSLDLFGNASEASCINEDPILSNSTGFSGGYSQNHLLSDLDSWIEFTARGCGSNFGLEQYQTGVLSGLLLTRLDEIQSGILALGNGSYCWAFGSECTPSNVGSSLAASGVVRIRLQRTVSSEANSISLLNPTWNHLNVFATGTDDASPISLSECSNNWPEVTCEAILLGPAKMFKVRASFGCFDLENQFAKMEKKLDGGFVDVHDQMLRFEYDEEYLDADGQLTYYVYKLPMDTDPVLSSEMNELEIQYGDNRVALDVSSLELNYYILEVINQKNESWYLRFRVN